MLEREQIDYLLASAYNAAIRAGVKILEVYNSDDFDIDTRSNNTPVTLADRVAHETIKNYLSKTRIPILSQEGRDLLYSERCNWDLFWLIDPLDGTKEFIKRNGEFTVNIALMVDNEPLFGVVYAPCFNLMYFSDADRGAFSREDVFPDPEASFTISQIFDGARRLPLTSESNEPVRVVVSRSHLTPQTDEFVERVREKHGGAEVLKSGSSLKFCMVAEGTADYYVRTTKTFEWDTAAAHSVARAAGAEAYSLDNGEVLKYNKEDLAHPYFVCRGKYVSES